MESRSKRKGPAGVAVALAVIAAAATSGPLLAQSSVYVDPPLIHDEVLGAGSMIEVTVRCDMIEASNGMDFAIRWDPAVLMLAAVDSGSYWATGPWIQIGPSQSAGYWGLARVFTGFGLAPAGSYSLFTMAFLVVGTGTTPITLTNTRPGWPDNGTPDPIYVTGAFQDATFASTIHGTFSNMELLPIPAPAGLVQFDEPGGLSQPAGFVSDDAVVAFGARIGGPYPWAFVRLQVEVAVDGAPFDGLHLLDGAPLSGSDEPSEIAPPPLQPGSYRWRARTAWAGQVSPWVEFDAPAGPAFRIAGPPVVPPAAPEGGWPVDGSDGGRCAQSAETTARAGAALLALGLMGIRRARS